jgi:hypothetical protein
MLIILIVGAVLLLVGVYVVLLNGVNALGGQTEKQRRMRDLGSQGADGGLSPATRLVGPASPLGPVQPPFPMPPPPTTGPAAHPSSAAGGFRDAAFAP